jgi:hypothetical protein
MPINGQKIPSVMFLSSIMVNLSAKQGANSKVASSHRILKAKQLKDDEDVG